LFDHVIKEFEVGYAEFSHLLENLLNVKMTQLWQVLVQVLWDGFTGRFQDCVPLQAVEVFWQRDLVHYQVVLHSVVKELLKKTLYGFFGLLLSVGDQKDVIDFLGNVKK
jgi:hypothetical protein